MLFTGVAYSITAFPVLCRILTELKLLDTTVGIIVLSAGVGNDIGKLFYSLITACKNDDMLTSFHFKLAGHCLRLVLPLSMRGPGSQLYTFS